MCAGMLTDIGMCTGVSAIFVCVYYVGAWGLGVIVVYDINWCYYILFDKFM